MLDVSGDQATWSGVRDEMVAGTQEPEPTGEGVHRKDLAAPEATPYAG
jgi:hypothetical protein